MIEGKKVLGLILARAGSKGLPGKNLRDLCGKPLIAWSIEAGLMSRYVDDVVVSTDGESLAEAARLHGAEVPFMRPAELATDTAASIDAVEHAVSWLGDHQRVYDVLVLLEPTSPLREAIDVDNALEMLLACGARSIVSVCRAEALHPDFLYRMETDSRLHPFMGKQPDARRRQDIDDLYYLDGSVYASHMGALLEHRSFYHHATIAYPVTKWKAPEIDDEVDFLIVEAIMRHRRMGF